MGRRTVNKEKIIGFHIKLKGHNLPNIKSKMFDLREKLGLFHCFSMYNYVFYVNAKEKVHTFLVRIKFNSYNDKYDKESFILFLKKLKLKFNVKEEKFNDEVRAACIGSRMADYIRIYDLEENVDGVIHNMMNSLGNSYFDESLFYVRKGAQILLEVDKGR
jgi:hypothetical protein